MSDEKWPKQLWLLRHGQSAGNVARDAAEAAGHHVIDIADRDIDVPLSPLGEEQSRALGEWFGRQPERLRPTVVLCSPYVRAQQTARIVSEAAGLSKESVVFDTDERLREKEFGILDRLTVFGIKSKFPELSEQRSHVGKFYFRPPGGESWCDVILRLRSFMDTLSRDYRGERVLVVGHQVIVNCFRYLLDHLTEAEILGIDRLGDVPNCSLTHYEFEAHAGKHGELLLREANFVAPLEQAGAEVTAEPDASTAAKA